MAERGASVATGKYTDKPADGRPAPARNGSGVSRRLLLVAAGGVMVGIGTVAGRGGGHLADKALDQAPHPATRAAAARKPAPAASAREPRTAAGHTRQARTVKQVDPGQPMYYLDDGPKVIALTIDDGPSPVYTPQVLRILERYRVTASFSMIGQSVRYYPAVAREVADAGHVIVNHTWNHANLRWLGPAGIREEIAQATDAIQAATGRRPRMFRAPYGAWPRAALEYCAREGLTPLDWSVDPRDWARPGVGEIVGTIMRTTRTGSIILEHDGGGDRSQTVAALEIVIPRLLDEGYRFQAP